MKIQMTLSTLQEILDNAREAKKYNTSLSNTVVIELLQECDTHTGNDGISVEQLSDYAECYGKNIYVTGF